MLLKTKKVSDKPNPCPIIVDKRYLCGYFLLYKNSFYFCNPDFNIKV